MASRPVIGFLAAVLVCAVSALPASAVVRITPASEAAAATGSLAVTGLQTDYMTDPLGIDDTHPSLGWHLTSSGTNQTQSKYEILVANRLGDLHLGSPTVWDSGEVSSAESVQVPYTGPSSAVIDTVLVEG